MNIKDMLNKRLSNNNVTEQDTKLEELKEAHLDEISGAHTDNHYSQHDDLPEVRML
jgi:hypothetical protein